MRTEPVLNIGKGFDDKPNFYYGYPDRPHWRAYGSGWSRIEIRREGDSGLFIQATETPEDGRGGKEVWIELPANAVEALKKFLNQ